MTRLLARRLLARVAGSLIRFAVVVISAFLSLADGQVQEYFSAGNTLQDTEAVAVDSTGSVYVGGLGGTYRISPGGEIVKVLETSSAELVVDDEDTLFVRSGGDVYSRSVSGDVALVYASCTLGCQPAQRLGLGPGGAYAITGNDFVGQPRLRQLEAGGVGDPVGVFGVITAFAFDGAGNLYVAGILGDDPSDFLFFTTAVVLVPADGSPVEFLMDDTGDGMGNALGWPTDLTVDAAGNVYVAGSTSNNVLRIGQDGTIEEVLDENGDGQHSLEHPEALQVDGSGNLFVVGEQSHNAFRVTPSGSITEIIDGDGDGMGAELFWGSALALDPSTQSVYVTGRHSDNAFRITPGGRIDEIIDITADGSGFPLMNEPRALALDLQGNLYVAACASNTVLRVDPMGAVDVLLDGSGGGSGYPLNQPNSLAIDAAGALYVCGFGSSNVFRVDPDGTATQLFSSAGDGTTAGLNGPVGVAVDDSFNVYVADGGGGRLLKIAPSGTSEVLVDSSGDGDGNELQLARNPLLDPAGNVYVAGEGSANVLRVSPTGEITEVLGSLGDGTGNALDRPMEVALDLTGNLYVVGRYSDNAFKISPSGVPSLILAREGDGENLLSRPRGVAVGAAGEVYCLGDASENLFRIDPDGTITEVLDRTGDGNSPLDLPLDVVVDAQGNVYVAGGTSDNVFKISPPACAQFPGASFRNAGTNPPSYTVTPASIGGSLDFTVNLDTTGHDQALVIGFDSPFEFPLAGGQTLLCLDLLGSGGELINTGFHPGPLATMSLPVPNDPTLIGFEVSTQALHAFGVVPFALSNAQDVVIGGCP